MQTLKNLIELAQDFIIINILYIKMKIVMISHRDGVSIWNMIKGLMNKDIFDKYFVEIEVEICANILIKIAEKNDEIGRENEKLNDIYYRQIDSIRRTLMIMLSR